MNREEMIMKRVQEHYDYLKSKGYEIVFLALQGSQNYGLDVYDDDYMSDIDTRAVVLPSFENFVYSRKPISETLILDNDEHIDVKDVRIMFDLYTKQNIQFIETLFTEFKIVNPKYKNIIQTLFDNAEEIAHLDYNKALKCMAGMSKDKLNALQHPYPTIIDKIEKFGYDPKQLHHILRMNDFIKKYVQNKPYKECLIPDNKEYLIKVKKGFLPCSEAVELANKIDEETHTIKENFSLENNKVNYKALVILDQVKRNLLYQRFREELLK